MANYYRHYAGEPDPRVRQRIGQGGQPLAANSDGSYPINPLPSQGGIYNPHEIQISKYNSINAHQHFGQNRQSLGQPDTPIPSRPQNFDETYFPQNNQLSVQQEPDIIYKKRIRYLFINSKDRNLASFPQPQEYQIHFNPASGADNASGETGEVYRNVESIELIGGTIPDQQSVTDEPFLLLHIDELAGTFEGTNVENKKVFAIIQMAAPVVSGKFINIPDDMTKNTMRYFDPPIAQLSKMTIKLTDQSGALFNFGDDTGGSPPNTGFQNSLVFKITEKVVDTKQIMTRAVF